MFIKPMPVLPEVGITDPFNGNTSPVLPIVSNKSFKSQKTKHRRRKKEIEDAALLAELVVFHSL